MWGPCSVLGPGDTKTAPCPQGPQRGRRLRGDQAASSVSWDGRARMHSVLMLQDQRSNEGQPGGRRWLGLGGRVSTRCRRWQREDGKEDQP